QGGWENVQAYTVSIEGQVYQPYSTSNLIWGNVPGSVGEVSKIGVILGALMLVFTKIGSWRIMVSMVLGAMFMSLLLNIINASFSSELTNAFLSVPWYYQFAMGSFFFAMAFMATDPVTASGTSTGKWMYGFMIGVIGIIIRVLNPAYPEGWMLAILLLNVFAPLIDHVVLQQNIKRRLNRVKV
ncbi:MAG: Na+-transporting NADH:ubiquinone oxidoreductase subunit B, partial [Flavobacteriaceae bacterium]